MDYSADYSFNNLNGSSWRAIIGHPFRHSILQSVTVKYQTGRWVVTGKLLHSLFINRQKNVEQTDRTDVQINSARNMRRLSPSLSLSYKLLEDEEFFLRASYKNIFRSPTFNESYYYHYGSTDLNPELTDQWNI